MNTEIIKIVVKLPKCNYEILQYIPGAASGEEEPSDF